MTLDFDPFTIPRGLVAYLATASEADVERHSAAFAKRAVAAKHVLVAVAELRLAAAKAESLTIELAIEELLEATRDLHDYDPTSD